MSLNYFKKILMSGLNVKEKATLEEELNPLETAVQYTPQELTEEQLIQVRKNLGLHYNGAKTVNIEWDKDTTGRAAIVISTMPPRVAYKVSDTVFSEDDLIGTILTLNINSTRFTQKVTKENVVTPCAGFTLDQNQYWFSANAGEYPVFTVEESGTYFTLSEYQPTPLSMSNEININWDGDTTEKPQMRDRYGTPMAFYKVSSEMPPSDWLAGANYSLNNIPDMPDASFKIDTEQIKQLDYNAYLVKYSGPYISYSEVIMVGTAGKHENSEGTYGINLPEDGMYFLKNSDSNAFVSNLSYHTNAIHKIEQQYIPDTIATKAYVDQQIREAISEAYNT